MTEEKVLDLRITEKGWIIGAEGATALKQVAGNLRDYGEFYSIANVGLLRQGDKWERAFSRLLEHSLRLCWPRSQ